MAIVADVLSFVQQLAPTYMKEEWDNVGLLCGCKSQPVTKVLVALDPFMPVCQEAISWGAELIVTHHPLILHPLYAITDATSVGKAVHFLASHGISAISAHTNLDCAPGGVNDTLANVLGLSDTQVLSPAGIDDAGRPWGLIRSGNVPAQSLEDFLSHVKSRLGCPGLRYVNSEKPVHRVAVGGGACADEIVRVFDAGCDTFVTADVKYNQFWDARDMGLNLIDAGHFYTENPVCTVLAEKLRTKFPDLTVQLSKNHSDCMKFW